MSRWRILISILGAALLSVGPAGGQNQQRIRVEVSAVPLTVGVTDGSGSPILDLTASDFQIFEDGVGQQLSFFAAPANGLAESSAPHSPAAAAEAAGPVGSGPRSYLILVGRIRQDPFETLEALADFVANRLRPQDRVALMSYSRATLFTNRFAEVAQLIRAYAREKAAIDATLRQRERLALFAATSTSPAPAVRARIERLFAESTLSHRQVVDPLTYSRDEVDRISSRLDDVGFFGTEDLQRMLDSMGVPEAGVFLNVQNRMDVAERVARSDLDDLSYLAQRAATSIDTQQLAAAIEYLRYLDGEKYLFYLNSDGLAQSREERLNLTRRASDARVRLYVFQTGGVEMPEGDLALTTGAVGARGVLNRDRGTQTTLYGGRQSVSLTLGTLDKLASETGGKAFLRTDMAGALSEAGQIIESNYLLAYTPSNADYDLEFRTIEVRVARPGLRLHHRTGYVAMPPLNDEQRLQSLAAGRILSAAAQPGPLSDVPIRSSLIVADHAHEGSVMKIQIDIALAAGLFERRGDKYWTDIILACLVTGSDRRRAWPSWDRLTLNLTPANYRKALRDGLQLTREIEVPVPAAGGRLQVVAYHPTRDLLGSDRLEIP